MLYLISNENRSLNRRFPAGVVLDFGTGDVLVTHSTNALTVSGGVFATEALTATTITGAGVLSIDDTTVPNGPTSGSFHTDGGIGVAGFAWFGDKVRIDTSLGIGTSFPTSDISFASTGTGVHSSNRVGLSGQDYATDDARLYITSEAGAAIILGGDALTFQGSTDSVLVANEVSLGGYELSAGNRALAISQESAVIAEADETKFSDKLPVRINGTTYYIMLTQT